MRSKKFISTFGILGISNIGHKVKTDDFSIEQSFTKLKFLIETLLEEIKPVVTEIYEFE